MYLVLLSPLFHSSPSSLSLSLSLFFSCLWLIGEICLSVEQFIFYIRLSADLWFCLVSTPISCILYKLVLCQSQSIDSVVMPSAKSAWGSLGLSLQTFLWPRLMLWLGWPLWFLLWLQDASQQQSLWKFEKNKVYYL